MSAEDRIQYLLRAATRAEDEGDAKVARLFRRMAEEAQPVEVSGRLRWALPE
jgi:rubrerythrin